MARYANDIFTVAEEARSRSVDMGLGGDIHVSDYDGQAVYMPGASVEAYMAYYEGLGGIPSPESNTPSVDRIEALRAIVQEVLKKGKPQMTQIEGKILKADDEQRMVYGYASVVTEGGKPVIDRQGDVIEPDTLVIAVTKFMEHVRVGKQMHHGDPVGVVVHSWPSVKEVNDSVGITSDREGWLVGFKVYDDEVWKRVKSGELAAFSIGGRAIKEDYCED